ncbi:unnamed protein product, partial [marine sediment metagenome]
MIYDDIEYNDNELVVVIGRKYELPSLETSMLPVGAVTKIHENEYGSIEIKC